MTIQTLPTEMHAVGYRFAHPIEKATLADIILPTPIPNDDDLLVEVKAVSVNPVDVKIRGNVDAPEGQHKVLGWDAAGIVRQVGRHVTGFQPGDRVWYAGALDRPGSNGQFQCVNAKIASAMPKTLSFADAAAMPLTALTAWELLFDRLKAGLEPESSTLLIVGAAGGVGSVLTQLAKQLTSLTVIGTASRPESQASVKKMGADHVIDHAKPLQPQLDALGVEAVTHVASLNHTEAHLEQLVDCLIPQGKLALIDDPEQLDIRKLKSKSISLHWEFMFTRSLYSTTDMYQQHVILANVAKLVDQGVLKSTASHQLTGLNAANLTLAHQAVESGRTIGKYVIAEH
ncbi:zinc-binding alcohol dehydrogenase family protein [Salinivibrio sp. IB870]|uniref:zinc-binding alcohol dehydrogenase family protein n=1 Tax=Salinivibrio sp. IB870 TaxID=1766121 RepID=UPI003FD30377